MVRSFALFSSSGCSLLVGIHKHTYIYIYYSKQRDNLVPAAPQKQLQDMATTFLGPRAATSSRRGPNWPSRSAQNHGPISQNRDYTQYRVHDFGCLAVPGTCRYGFYTWSPKVLSDPTKPLYFVGYLLILCRVSYEEPYKKEGSGSPR